MKKFFIAGIAAWVLLASCQKEVNEPNLNQLTEAEKQGLLFTRQEEKLAYDVYRFAFEKYGSNIFDNISKSESTHQNFIQELLDKYELGNPVKNMGPGEFENESLQVLYGQLTTKAEKSLAEAMEVGATIEDLDINDLMQLTTETDKDELINVYDMLTCGSRNHLRGFTGQLKNMGREYTPQYLEEEIYNEIINGVHESCGR